MYGDHWFDGELFGTKTSDEKFVGLAERFGSISNVIDGMFGLPSALFSPVVYTRKPTALSRLTGWPRKSCSSG